MEQQTLIQQATAAFEQHYRVDANDPSQQDRLQVWLQAYQAANSVHAMPQAQQLAQWHTIDTADAALGRSVRRLLDGGASDLRDSPKSFLSTVQRLASEAAQSTSAT